MAGLLPLTAAISAAYLSMQLELVPACNPLVDGCVSISRTGRHGLPNIVFRALLLPAAVFQALTWVLCSQWLRTLPSANQANSPSINWLATLGILAGVFLILYGSFLGTEGGAYRWLRQYGTIFYFSFTYLCMVLLLSGLRREQRIERLTVPTLTAVCLLLLVLGLINTLVAQLFDDPLKDRIENITEWWLGLGFVLVFFILANTWRRLRVAMYLPNHHAQ
jgi:hypothetical protein